LIRQCFQNSLQTVIGRIVISADHQFITRLEFDDDSVIDQSPNPPKHLDDATKQLTTYFEYPLAKFQLPLLPAATKFQSHVRQALDKIAAGQTTNYQAIAQKSWPTPISPSRGYAIVQKSNFNPHTLPSGRR